jgi:hypothetical protein
MTQQEINEVDGGIFTELKEDYFRNMNAGEFVEYIDAIFLIQKKRILEHKLIGKPEAFNEKYMQQSATMNRMLRSLIQEKDVKDPERARLCWAHSYWWNRTHLLEAFAKSVTGGIKTKKDIKQGGKTLKKLISGEKDVKDIHPQFLALIDKLNVANPKLS